MWACAITVAPPKHPLAEQALRTAQPGDLVFIGDAGMWTDLAASFSATDHRYGHVGILTGSHGDWAVIDAGGPMLGGDAGVARRSLAAFIGTARRVGLYPVDLTPPEREAFLAAAEAAADARVPFDRAFDLETPDAVYCTEFIWRTLSAATGRDAVPNKSVTEGRDLISLEDLLNAPMVGAGQPILLRGHGLADQGAAPLSAEPTTDPEESPRP